MCSLRRKEMPKKQDNLSSQLSLDFNGVTVNNTSQPSRTENLFYLNDAVKSRAESHKKEILNLFSNYAAKLNW